MSCVPRLDVKATRCDLPRIIRSAWAWHQKAHPRLQGIKLGSKLFTDRKSIVAPSARRRWLEVDASPQPLARLVLSRRPSEVESLQGRPMLSYLNPRALISSGR